MRGKVLRSLGILLLVAVAILVWQGYVLFYGKPAKVDRMATRQFAMFLLQEPEILTRLGFLDGSVLDFHSDDLTPRTQTHRDGQKQRLQQFLRELERYERDTLPPDQALTYDVWSWWLEAEAAAAGQFYAVPIAALSGPYEVSQFGIQAAFPELMTRLHALTNDKSVENYLSRLRKFGETVDQSISVFNDHAARGVLAPRFILERVLRDIESFRAPLAKDNALVTNLTNKIQPAERFTDSEISPLRDDASEGVAQVVYPALDRLVAAVEARLDEARVERPGVLALHEGEEYYAARIRVHTSTNYTAEELHDLGLREVSRLSNEIDKMLVELGYEQGPTSERLAQLGEDYSYGLENTEAGRRQLMTIADKLIREAENASKPYFEKFPTSAVEVRPIPDYAANSASNSYSRPTPNGARPGYYNLNVMMPSRANAVDLPTLTYHEAVPGHHFQMARAVESDMPILRQNLPFTAYGEGWALYAETLAAEMGLYENNPAGAVGALKSELYRAVRLVVDTGLHTMGWGREYAADYMASTIGGSPQNWLGEVDRYVVSPGQALAYKVGQLKITELRLRAQEKLGEDFDIAEFHEEILKDGPLPLDLLDRKISRWIEQRAES